MVAMMFVECRNGCEVAGLRLSQFVAKDDRDSLTTPYVLAQFGTNASHYSAH